MASRRRGRGIRGACRRGGPRRRKGRPVGRGLGRDPGAPRARPAAVRLLVPLRARARAAKLAGAARRGAGVACAGGSFTRAATSRRPSSPPRSGFRPSTTGSGRWCRSRCSSALLRPSRRSGARRGSSRPIRGRVPGLYVDVVPPSLTATSRSAGASGCGVAGSDPVDPPPWLEELAPPARLRHDGHRLQPVRRSFAPLVDGLARSGVGALVTVGRDVDPVHARRRAPADPGRAFVPQAQVLPHARPWSPTAARARFSAPLRRGCHSC